MDDILKKASNKELSDFERTYGKPLPKSLLEFYVENGYGIISNNPERPQRLLSPYEMLDFIEGTYEFAYVDYRSFYQSIEKIGLVFMEYSQNMFFWIGTENDNFGKIYYYNYLVSNSLEELIDMIHKGIRPTQNIRA